ncbi:MAG: hypothetical protein GTO14_16015 [Anaerolineales bacterium]|nr:hypothetical protein [Anaerolineales bacterium]
MRNKGIYRFRNWEEEAKWEHAGGGVIGSDVAVWALANDPQRSQGLWAGTDLGLYCSPNAGLDGNLLSAFSGMSVQGLLVFENKLFVRTAEGVSLAELGEARRVDGIWTRAFILAQGLKCTDLTPTATWTPVLPHTLTTTKTPTWTATWTPVPTTTGTPTSTPTPEGMNFLERLERIGKFIDNITPIFVPAFAIIILAWLGIQMRKRGMRWRQVFRTLFRFLSKMIPESFKKAFEEIKDDKDGDIHGNSKPSTPANGES